MPTNLLLIICPPFWEKLPPLGAAYISEYLANKGYNVRIYDLNISIYHELSKEFKKNWTINTDYITRDFFQYCFDNFPDYFNEIIDIIRKEEINYVGFTVLKGNRIFTLNTARFIKQNIEGVKIIFGGPEVFTMSLENFTGTDGVNYLVVGEGEKAVEEILTEGKKMQITGKAPKNKIFQFRQLDDINFYPLYRNLDLSLYPRRNSLPILASRGCVNRCSFCSEKLLYRKYRMRDPANILEEILYHKKTNNIKWFTFYDSMFNGHPGKLEKLMDLMLANKTDIFWDAQIYIRNDMGIELMKKMKEAGCINLFVGFENGADRILQMMNKNFSTQDAVRFFNNLNKAGLQFEISLILHYPGETEEDFQATVDFLINNKNIIPKIAQINTFKNYPGTSVDIPPYYDYREGEIKVNYLIKKLEENKIKFTPSYINNLI